MVELDPIKVVVRVRETSDELYFENTETQQVFLKGRVTN
jgi:hypothetical protein